MQVLVYNAFAQGDFSGNPAAVVPYRRGEAPPAALMQAIAEQHNLSETAFVELDADDDGARGLRWFTPAQEVRLCGHATLATAAALHEAHGLGGAAGELSFRTRAGRLTCALTDGTWSMDFPADEPQAAPAEVAEAVTRAAGVVPPAGRLFVGADDAMLVLGDAAAVRSFAQTAAVREIPKRGLIVTAAGDGDYDVVSRCFYPAYGIDEDAATGSAHTLLGVYWARRLGRDRLRCLQASRRTGSLDVRYDGGTRIGVGGAARAYLRGEIAVPTY